MTKLFMWKTCPDFKLQSAGISIAQLGEVQKKQEYFAQKHDIPFLQIVPELSTYSELDPSTIQTSLSIWQPRERLIFFHSGISVWEFSVNIGDIEDFQDVDKLMIDNSNYFSTAYAHKKQQCKQYHEFGDLCSSCKDYDLQPVFTIFVVKEEEHLDLLSDLIALKDHLRGFEEFLMKFEIRRLMSKNYQVLYIPKTQWKRKPIIFETLLWTSVLVKVHMQFNYTLLQRSLDNIPDINFLQNTIDKQQEVFFKLFFFHYYWINPKFLISKTGERLNLRSLPLNSLYFAYKTLDHKNYWESYEEVLSLLPKKPVGLMMDLYECCDSLPGNLLGEFIQQMNPFNFQLPSSAHFYNKLDKLRQEICLALLEDARNKLSIYKTPSEKFKSEITLTRTKIATMIGMSTGSGGKKVQSAIDDLVKYRFVIKLSAKVIKRKGQANDYYRINDEFPYVSLSLQLKP